MKTTLKRLQPLIGFVVSAVLVYLVLFRPHPGDLFAGRAGLWAALFGDPRLGFHDLATAAEQLRWGPALLGVAALIGSLYIRAWRWQTIISEVGRAEYWSVFHGLNAGYLLNNVLPLRAGELLRGIIVARRNELPAPAVVSSVVVERLFDLAGLALVFGVTVLAFPFPGWLRATGGILSLGLLAALFAGFALSTQHQRLVRWHGGLAQRRQSWWVRLIEKVLELIQGLGALKRPMILLRVLWTTVLMYVLYVAVMKLVLDAFQFTDGRYPGLAGEAWIQASALTIITALGFAIPSAPGGVGTYHGAVLLGLSWFDVPEGMGVVFAAVMHAVNYITLTLIGLIGLWRLKLSWSEMVRTAKRGEEAQSPADEDAFEDADSPQESSRNS